ncbi:MAG TPA: hypothetical protein VGD00_11320 [Solirubrobacteraceae bacterium]
MPLGFYFKPENFPPETYDEALSRLEKAGAGTPPGRSYHCALLGTDGMIQVFDVWDSWEDFDRFGETLVPIMSELGSSPGPPMVNELHNVIVG